MLEPVPRAPQVVFGKQALEHVEGARASNTAAQIIPHLRVFECPEKRSMIGLQFGDHVLRSLTHSGRKRRRASKSTKSCTTC